MARKNTKSNNLTAQKNKVIKIFKELKNEKKSSAPPIIPLYEKNILIGYLRAVTISAVEDDKEIERLAKWRKKSEKWFPAQFKVTKEGTRKWLEERLLNIKDRFLFMVETPTGRPIGHVGLFRFDFKNKSCEIDNVIRGEVGPKGIMTQSILSLIQWAKMYLRIYHFSLEVFSDNEKAIRLYQRCRFTPFKKIPLIREIERDRVSWVESPSASKKVKRYNLYMRKEKK